jgi:flagellar basal-body rod protein FlgB
MANDVGALGAIGAGGNGVLGDRTSVAIERALTGLSARQRASADNIANLQTPGYRAKRVDFEASLAAALRAGRPEGAVVSTALSPTEARVDGNNVDLDDETLLLTKIGLGYQTMVQAMDAKMQLLRTSIGDR